MTGADGSISFWHLAAGIYARVAEERGARRIRRGTGDRELHRRHRRANRGPRAGQTNFEDDFTKVRISSAISPTSPRSRGAKLTVTDSEGTTIDSWTSTTEDHEIDALAPGKYTLTEQRPTTHDQAESIEFEVKRPGRSRPSRCTTRPSPSAARSTSDRRR